MNKALWRSRRTAIVIAAWLPLVWTGPVLAQPAGSSENRGAIRLTAAADVPSVYVFRGFVQETDPQLTVLPSVDVGVALGSGGGAVRRVGINVGSRHALLTGSSGLDGLTARLHYQEDFYATFAVRLGESLSVGTTYTAYTSPNNLFNTVKEMSIRVDDRRWPNAYGLTAFELTGAWDGFDDGTGSYLELGARPTVPIGSSKVSLAVPARLGLSLKNYYQGFGGDSRFGFFEIGGLVRMPLGAPGRFGAWDVHGGADVYVFGDTTRAFNDGDKGKVVGLIGVGVTY